MKLLALTIAFLGTYPYPTDMIANDINIKLSIAALSIVALETT
jgi:hypothetical protein